MLLTCGSRSLQEEELDKFDCEHGQWIVRLRGTGTFNRFRIFEEPQEIEAV